MKRLMILGAVWALAVARPELYKEKEDFQFSRSSSDDGTKSGFYGAQRGNVGGNYERAHNMDSLAQNQMSGLVRQVEGELGDGARTRTGSVYTAANSRGTYGSGRFDLSNLGGRNFQEGSSYGDSQSQSQSSLSAASAYNAAYANSRSQSSRQSGYQATGHSGLNLQSDDLQALDHTQGTGQYDYGRQTSHAAGYNAQSGFQQHAAYDTSNTNLHSGGYGSNVQTRLISATPVRIIVRPGTRVTIPVAAQSYDLTHGSTLIDQNSLNSDAEVLSTDNQRTVYRPSNAKHYESSYNYRKEWEKHDTIPSTDFSPTSSPISQNSELLEDGQAVRAASEQYDTRRVDSQRARSAYAGYNTNVKSTSGHSRFDYDTQRNAASHTNGNAYSAAQYGTNHQETSSDSSLNGYNIQSQYNAGRYHGAAADALTQAAVHNTGVNAAADLNSQVENLNTKPKSYHSAYSYHKSWERQGDPYVIKPASGAYYDGQSSQRLTTGSTQNLGSDSHYQHTHASGADCDENGHIRVARSYNTDQFQDTQQQSQNLEDLGQQQQSQNLEDFGQQQQSQNLEDLGQQQQSQNLEDFGQQQQSQNLEDLGQQQQSQNLEDFGQQQQSQNLEDFGQQQQSQNLEDFTQQQQSQKLEDFGQQQHSQNLDYFGQQQQSQKLEDFGQQQQDLGQQVENLGQQTQVLWDSQQEAGQQTQNTWDNLDNLSQQSHKKWNEDLGQKPQDIDNQWSNVEQNNQNNLGQRTQDTETELKINPAQDKWDFDYKNQDDKQNVTTYDQEHEQSNKFNQQETQSQLSDDDNLNYFHQSQKHNNDQMSVWNKFDFGSDQNVQQNKYNNEHTNANDQQPLNSGRNPDRSQSVHHNVNDGLTAGQITSITQQYSNIPDTNEQSNTGYFNLHNGHFNIHTNRNEFSNNENTFEETHRLHQFTKYNFSNSHRQEQTMNTDSYSHVNAFDTISPNTVPLSSLWNKLDNLEQNLSAGDVNKGEGHAFSKVETNNQNSHRNSMHAHHNMESTSQENHNNQMKPYHDLIHIIDKDISKNNTNDTKTEKESSLDVGRGDIGPEDLSDLKPDKYPSDTPVSSETIQNRDENSVKNNTNAHNYNQGVQNHESTHGLNNFQQHHDFEVQKHAENTEQQNLHVFSLHENIEPPNPKDSEKQHNLEQHSVQDYEESSEQQNLKDIAQQENKEQINLHDFGKQDNLEQQTSQDFGHQVNIEQQNLHDFGKQDNLEQQNLQDFGHTVNIQQQNVHDFGKQDNLEQQTSQDFGHQVNMEQQNLHDFGKQDNLEQQTSQDFGHQVNIEQQNLHGFGKQDNLEQQTSQDFGHQVNIEQQNLHDFGKQDNLEQQNLQDFGHTVNIQQQNVHNFGKQDNLEQQTSQDFGHQVNIEQQNLHDFGKQDNLEQQSSQDFGQQENLGQQNFHDFGKQDNLEQQSSQDFVQQENLGQQNSQDFRWQENLEQQNLQYGSQDNLQQQNKNLEQLTQDPEQSPKYSKEERTALPKNNVLSQNFLAPPEVIEQPIVKKQNNDLQSISAQTPSTEVSPEEPVTESTGFWNSVGNKLSRAKSKIASWF